MQDSTTLGRGSVGLLIFAGLDVVGPGAAVLLLALDGPSSFRELVEDCLIFGGIAMVGALALTARVVGTPSGLVLVNLLTYAVVPTGQVTRITADAGLRFELVDGRRLGSFCFGDSLVGRWTGQRRATFAKGRCESWLRSTVRHAHSRSACRGVRMAAITLALGLPAGYAAVGAATRWMAT